MCSIVLLYGGGIILSLYKVYAYGQDIIIKMDLLLEHLTAFPFFVTLSLYPFSLSSEKEQLAEEDDDELKEVLDLRKIAVQLLQQEQQNRCAHARTSFFR